MPRDSGRATGSRSEGRRLFSHATPSLSASRRFGVGPVGTEHGLRVGLAFRAHSARRCPRSQAVAMVALLHLGCALICARFRQLAEAVPS